MSLTSTPLPLTSKIKSIRIESIDLLRGLVIILMALDHVRDYFHADAYIFSPTDLTKTTVPLFFTRWITHFCAPVFVFLAGTSAFLVGSRKGKDALSAFLFKRGLWLIVLEFTVVNFSWFFNVHFSFIALTVIWALGIGMVILSAAIHLPYKGILILGLLLVAGHNILDSVNITGNEVAANVWSVFNMPSAFQLGHFHVFVGYPILPWAGIMLSGYCFGALYTSSFDPEKRRKILFQLGWGMILLFVVIRFINLYGEPSPWSTQPNAAFTFLSFINVTKYPPSLLYVLITLGPAMLFLAVSEKVTGKVSQYITALGRVPMFFYIIHIYLIHILGVIGAVATGYHASEMTFVTWVTDTSNLKGYGFSLGIVYLVWIAVVVFLFPLCLWYDRYKTNHKEKWWLSYL